MSTSGNIDTHRAIEHFVKECRSGVALSLVAPASQMSLPWRWKSTFGHFSQDVVSVCWESWWGGSCRWTCVQPHTDLFAIDSAHMLCTRPCLRMALPCCRGPVGTMPWTKDSTLSGRWPPSLPPTATSNLSRSKPAGETIAPALLLHCS